MFISGPILGDQSDSNCLFCRIAGGAIPASVVARDDLTLAFEDIHPQAPVHVLVIPLEHFEDAHAVPGEVLEAMLAMAARVAEQRGLAGGYRMVFNRGADAGQTVFHAHLHVLGGRPLAWPPG